MTTVQSQIANQQSLAPFFYLRISGLPYYIFATIDPSSSRYGSFAWSAPTNYPSGWNRGGLMLPDDNIEQKLQDIIGGIASPGRVRLSVIDFPDPTHPGVGFFSRLFSPGRALTDSSVQKAPITASVHADSTSITVQDKSATFTDNTDVYIGSETIGIGDATGPDSNGVSTLPISARNKYACFGNTADNADTVFPPIPYHRIALDPSGAQNAGSIVSSEPVTVLGRHAALWIGHMRPDGMPEPETSSACMLLGRISNLDIGNVGGTFDITIESITADLQNGTVAPDLGSATIVPRIYLDSSAELWRTFGIQVDFTPIDGTDFISRSLQAITVPAGSYTPEALVATINGLIQAIDTGDSRVNIIYQGMTMSLANGEDLKPHFTFTFDLHDITDFGAVFIELTLLNGAGALFPIGGDVPAIQQAGLLTAMGFRDDRVGVPNQGKADNPSTRWQVTADEVVASVFIPTQLVTSTQIALVEPASGDFFDDQLDGTGKAYVRLGDGHIMELLEIDTGLDLLTLGTQLVIPANKSAKDQVVYYYVPRGQFAVVEQIAIIQSAPTTSGGGHGEFLGRLVASTPGQTRGILNVFPEGVGMGWLALMTESEWLVEFESAVTRVMFVDRSTKFSELFQPLSREHGLFISWDPATSKVRLRTLSIPQAGNADTFIFSESNRASPEDRTTQRLDLTNLRTSWKVQFGWDWASQSYTSGPVIFNDVVARSNYPNNARQESIEDKTLLVGSEIGEFIAKRFALYGASWTTCTRSVNKSGMLLSPGSMHQIVDATMVNPFTGAYGITSADAVYGLLTGISANPSTGAVTATFVVNSSDDQSLYRPWSPVGLVDFDNNSGGFARGYNSSTKTLAMLAHYGQGNDAQDFVAGDKIRVIVRNVPRAGAPYEYTDTVASIGADTIVVTTGLAGALSTTTDSIVMLQAYGSQTSDRKTGAHKVAFQGNGTKRIIAGDTTARLHKWS